MISGTAGFWDGFQEFLGWFQEFLGWFQELLSLECSGSPGPLPAPQADSQHCTVSECEDTGCRINQFDELNREASQIKMFPVPVMKSELFLRLYLGQQFLPLGTLMF